MKQRIFPAILLVGFGVYFFIDDWGQPSWSFLQSWPTLLLIVGVAFLGQAYIGKEHGMILPGIILTGFGIHFHVVGQLALWANDFGVFILIIALGFLLHYQKTGDGLFYGVAFLLLSVLLLFYDKVATGFGFLENGVSTIRQIWPYLFIGSGLFLLFFKRK